MRGQLAPVAVEAALECGGTTPLFVVASIAATRLTIDLQVNSCRTKEVFLEETLLKKGFFQTIFPKLLISYCNLISENL
jgi:hypothetical protein